MIAGINSRIFKANYKIYVTRWTCLNCVRCNISSGTSYSDTILFPRTNFPARPNIAKKDEIQEKAQFSKLYEWQRQNLQGPEFVLHDGPPYANGDLHMGHAVNKIIKDICNRSHVIRGNRVHYIPGWDCHGLPIELKALQQAKKSTKTKITDPINIREIARTFALDTVKKQKSAFMSWGVMADWENNCYLTLQGDYIKRQLDKFYELYKMGLVYRALKPVYWSPSSGTALAEAELEYDPQHKSTEVYVSFPIVEMGDEVRNLVQGKKLNAIIWTTTPWTLVANRAICYNPTMKYSLVTLNGRTEDLYIVASSLIETLEKILEVKMETFSEVPGTNLKSMKYANKLLTENLPFLPGSHVTAAKGSGLVHTAPAHGPDDFLVALDNKMAVECNVDEEGKYININQSLNGLDVLTSGQEAVIGQLGDDVLYRGTYTHSYPLDWRTKKPVILRASQQWFIDTAKLKQQALKALETVEILPPMNADQHRQGFKGQLERRPYWCISRQRAWGVPIPVLYSGDTPVIDKRIISNFCKLLESRGPDVWWDCDVSDLVPRDVADDLGLDLKTLVKGKDIMDIWLDSGVSWGALEGRQADLYAEGVDQLTGWFQASLLTCLPLTGKAPYKSIFVHGFVVDDKRRKMSKSIGNVIDPTAILHGGKQKGFNTAYGIDTMRWMIASHSTQHSQIIISKKLLDESQNEVYRIRNILKFLLGVISDLEDHHFYEKPLLNDFDTYIVNESNKFLTSIYDDYTKYRYNSVAKNILNFISNKVSGLYCHCVKDRLYCAAKESNERLSAQLVINTLLVSLCKSLAPILPHLVEEVWQHHPLYEKPFFFTQQIPVLKQKDSDKSIIDTILLLKKDICKLSKVELKKLRANIKVNEDIYEELTKLNIADNFSDGVLCEVLELSSVYLESVSNDSLDGKQWIIDINESDKQQCNRCRKFNALDCSDKCLRCENVILGIL